MKTVIFFLFLALRLKGRVKLIHEKILSALTCLSY